MLVKSPERMRLTEGHEGHAWWKEPGHSYRSICSYRKLPPPACPGTTCTVIYFRIVKSFKKKHDMVLARKLAPKRIGCHAGANKRMHWGRMDW